MDHLAERNRAMLSDFGEFVMAGLEAKCAPFWVATTAVLAGGGGAEVADFGRPNSGVVRIGESKNCRNFAFLPDFDAFLVAHFETKCVHF